MGTIYVRHTISPSSLHFCPPSLPHPQTPVAFAIHLSLTEDSLNKTLDYSHKVHHLPAGAPVADEADSTRTKVGGGRGIGRTKVGGALGGPRWEGQREDQGGRGSEYICTVQIYMHMIQI